jgi:hypothetical protein
VESGSIKATLSTTYLNTLESGTHTLQIQSTNGNAEGTFTISAAESLDNPDKDPVEDPDEGSAKDPAKDPDEGLDEDPTEDPAENPGDNSLKTPESDNDEKLKVDNNSKDSNQQNLASNENQSANESQDASEEDLANTGDTTAATILLLLGCLCAAAVTVRYARTRKN